ncbi:MAG: hypothetical protein FVQ83_07110 [Chloroflexi bacterium]|nr:hypothetical protein [Chloroflexota bacterium]
MREYDRRDYKFIHAPEIDGEGMTSMLWVNSSPFRKRLKTNLFEYIAELGGFGWELVPRVDDVWVLKRPNEKVRIDEEGVVY